MCTKLVCFKNNGFSKIFNEFSISFGYLDVGDTCTAAIRHDDIIVKHLYKVRFSITENIPSVIRPFTLSKHCPGENIAEALMLCNMIYDFKVSVLNVTEC